jgi:hypothetical protein
VIPSGTIPTTFWLVSQCLKRTAPQRDPNGIRSYIIRSVVTKKLPKVIKVNRIIGKGERSMNTEQNNTKPTDELHSPSTRGTEKHLSFYGNQKLKTFVPQNVPWSLQLGD